MKEEVTKTAKDTIYSLSFGSISEFNDYVCNTPLNGVFRWEKLSSNNTDRHFYGTSSFEEAQNLLKNGWSDMSKKLTQKLKIAEKAMAPVQKRRNVVSPVGYQAIVPLYLNGCPNNMVSSINVPVKQKVLNVYKNISYHGGWSAKEIEEESIKALMIVKRLESMGYRCNLYILKGTQVGGQKIIEKIKVKNSSERLNVSKLAFPLVNPSMQRRLHFRFIEVYPNTSKKFASGYGCSMSDSELKEHIGKNDILLPVSFNMSVQDMKSTEDIIKCFSK